MTMKELRGAALRLPPEDRARLASELINSLYALEDIDQAAVDAAWADEVRRRVEDVPTGNVSVVDGEQVLRELRERLNRRADINIALSVDEHVVRRARAAAEATGKSLSQVIRDYLAGLAARDDVEADIAELRELSAPAGGRSRDWNFDRDQLHDRS